ncbi:hypothetical protein GGD81_004612 [Rhodobium orientis]|uniref:Uncharacterized protein n=1 Tax=Rhodobium orientis TaxID=34017 RepID=A0A327JH78_9HYPH|nr:hypothetical protein [Rhodobium orientis]MBB4305532.1 hypothetical protein [Rhodobium orientis]MBK5949129.1 hypothetical protein [Rhodobium orientis]RAI24673.1 hypothetical protein CH339_21605 [Rhodobium orientis]
MNSQAEATIIVGSDDMESVRDWLAEYTGQAVPAADADALFRLAGCALVYFAERDGFDLWLMMSQGTEVQS